MTEETSNGSPAGEGRAAGQEAANVADLAAIDRQRMLDGEERRVGDHRGTVDRTAAAGGGQRNVDEDDFPDGDRPLAGDESDLLAEVGRAVAEDGPPRGVEIAVGAGQFDGKLLARQTLGIARGLGPGGKRFREGLADDVHFRRIEERAVLENEAEEFAVQGHRLTGGLIAQLAGGRTVIAELPGGLDETVGEA